MSIVVIALAYALGAVPFALLMARWSGTPDLRRVGSGNLGATNVARAAGARAGAAVAALDIAKGAVAVGIAGQFVGGTLVPVIAALAAILGHVFPVYTLFQGGKGVATAFGAFLVLAPLAALGAAAVFVVVAGITRYVSMGSVLAAIALPFAVHFTDGGRVMTIGAGIACALIVFRHQANILRLWHGAEHRVGERI